MKENWNTSSALEMLPLCHLLFIYSFKKYT